MKYIKRFLITLAGIFMAISISIVPITIFGVFFITPLILLSLTAAKIDKWFMGKSTEITDGDKQALEIAFLCTFGGLACGYGFIKERWTL